MCTVAVRHHIKSVKKGGELFTQKPMNDHRGLSCFRREEPNR